MLLRFRPDLRPFMGDPRYPRRLTIQWHYPADDTSGMPSDAQIAEMREVEDLLQEHLDYDRTAILAFVHTRSGTRTWHYYITDKKLVADRVNQALRNHPDLPLELQVINDPDWDELAQVYQGTSEP